jgi:hypothetical protein
VTRIVILIASLSVTVAPRAALAGMPSLTLTDLARMRLQSISFFLLLLLVSAVAVRFLWNGLRRDFSRLPRLTYGMSVVLVSLWGMLFLLVLTMVSGARELMTPRAWEKEGATYKLAKDDGKDRTVTETMRREHLAQLKTRLWAYAAAHGGALPADDSDSGIAAEAWETADLSRARYVYVPGGKADVGAAAVAYEPTVFYGPRFVLTSDGQIRTMGDEELHTMLAAVGGER